MFEPLIGRSSRQGRVNTRAHRAYMGVHHANPRACRVMTCSACIMFVFENVIRIGVTCSHTCWVNINYGQERVNIAIATVTAWST